MILQDLEKIIAGGESKTVEFKKSTAQLTRAGETLCTFLNGQGGRVFIGVTLECRVVGQQITGTFYRRGLIEQWGRGTNRIVELTVKAGHPEPEFTEIAGSVVVCFRPKSGSITVATTPTSGAEAESRPESRPEAIIAKTLVMLTNEPLGKAEIAHRLGHKSVSGRLNKAIRELSTDGLIEPTIPNKPQSRLQKYRLTAKGQAVVERTRTAEGTNQAKD